jgi:hypothetical protein
MVDHELIGLELPTVHATVEAERLRTFRRVIGSADAADTSASPTYLFALEMLYADRALAFIEDLGVEMASVLHSEQFFHYHEPVRVGDRLTFTSRVSDIFEKKGGALSFVVQNTRVMRDDGAHVADVARTLVIRN